MMSSTKPEAHNVSQCRQRSSHVHRQHTQNLVKFGRVVFELRERTDRQTDTHKYSSQYFVPFPVLGRRQSNVVWATGHCYCSKTPLVRFVVNLLYSNFTANRTNGAWAYIIAAYTVPYTVLCTATAIQRTGDVRNIKLKFRWEWMGTSVGRVSVPSVCLSVRPSQRIATSSDEDWAGPF